MASRNPVSRTGGPQQQQQPQPSSSSAISSNPPMGTVVTMPPSSAMSTGGTSMEQEEGVLRDVLEQLDIERSKRAELESKLRHLEKENVKLKENVTTTTTAAAAAAASANSKQQQQQHNKHQSNPQDQQEEIVSRSEFISMQAQVEGFKQIVNVLTQTKPAIAAASKSSIPIHILRLLEVMPWDPAAQEYIFGQEELYEWQIWDPRDMKWKSNIRSFPVLFKSLPVVKPKAFGAHDSDIQQQQQQLQQQQQQQSKDRSLLLFLAGGGGGGGGDKSASAATSNASAAYNIPSKHGMLTDERITKVYNIEAGFPLPSPEKGTWQWIGGWRVEKVENTSAAAASSSSSSSPPAGVAAASSSLMKPSAAATAGRLPCDDNGWSYAKDGQSFILDPANMVHDSAGYVEPSTAPDNNANNNNNNNANSNNNNVAGHPKYRIRRRRWARRRILIDYPFASERTKQYLFLLAENALLSLTVSKVTDQLVETKWLLTAAERDLFRTKAELQDKTALLEAVGISTEAFLFKSDDDDNPTAASAAPTSLANTESGNANVLHDFLSKNEQVKELGSKISQWVTSAAQRKPSEDLSAPGTGATAVASETTAAGALAAASAEGSTIASGSFSGVGSGNNDPRTTTTTTTEAASPERNQQSASMDSSSSSAFDWKKIGRSSAGGLMERIKQSQVVTQAQKHVSRASGSLQPQTSSGGTSVTSAASSAAGTGGVGTGGTTTTNPLSSASAATTTEETAAEF